MKYKRSSMLPKSQEKYYVAQALLMNSCLKSLREHSKLKLTAQQKTIETVATNSINLAIRKHGVAWLERIHDIMERYFLEHKDTILNSTGVDLVMMSTSKDALYHFYGVEVNPLVPFVYKPFHEVTSVADTETYLHYLYYLTEQLGITLADVTVDGITEKTQSKKKSKKSKKKSKIIPSKKSKVINASIVKVRKLLEAYGFTYVSNTHRICETTYRDYEVTLDYYKVGLAGIRKLLEDAKQQIDELENESND